MQKMTSGVAKPDVIFVVLSFVGNPLSNLDVWIEVSFFAKSDFPELDCFLLFYPELHSITTPTLLLAGSRDLILEAHTREMASYIPGCELHIFPGETHTSYLKRHVGKCIDLLIPFLEKAT